jgi:hypothetical protein
VTTTTLVNKFKVTAPFITSAFVVSGADAGAQVETTITVPLNTSAALSVQIDISPDGVTGWEKVSGIIGMHGGTGKDGVSPNIYSWGLGIKPDMVDQFLRVNFTVVTGGTWTLTVTETM